MRKYLCAALSPQTCKKRLRTALSQQTCKKRLRTARSPQTRKKAPVHRRVPLVRSSPCVIAPSRSPYFGHFAKALQNVSKVRCSLVWAIMDSSAETRAALAVRRRSVPFSVYAAWLCGMLHMENACRRNMHSNFSRYLQCTGVCIFTVVRRIFTAHAFAAYSISII